MILNLKRSKVGVLVVLLLLTTFGVNAAKNRRYSFEPPKGFSKNINLFTAYLPTSYYSKGDKKVTITIPAEMKAPGVPQTKEGKIHPDFITGKRNFSTQMGLKDWRIQNFQFSETPQSTKLEIIGTYKNTKGINNTFIEQHYFSKTNKVQSIHMLYPENANPKDIQEAKLSLDRFNPHFE